MIEAEVGELQVKALQIEKGHESSNENVIKKLGKI